MYFLLILRCMHVECMFNMVLTCDIPVLENDYKGALKGGFIVLHMSMNQNTFFAFACYDPSLFNLICCL